MFRRPIIAALALAALGVGSAYAQVGGPCIDFSDHQSFLNYCNTHGKITKGTETFEEGIIPPAGKSCFPGPMGPFPMPPWFPTGLAVTNMIIQDNIEPGPSPIPLHPSGDGCALYLIGTGFIGANSNKVGEDLFLAGIPASVDIIFTENDKTGVGVNLARVLGVPNGGWSVTVYNTLNIPIGVYMVPAPAGNEPEKDFFGVWCSPGIGRINIFDMAGLAPDALDNIESWVDVSTATKHSTWGQLKLSYR